MAKREKKPFNIISETRIQDIESSKDISSRANVLNAEKKHKRTRRGKDFSEPSVIHELMGSLEEALTEDLSEIQSITEGGDSADIPDKPAVKKHKASFAVGVFIIIMSVIGLISSFKFISGVINGIADNSALKIEFAMFIYPAVVNDPPTFNATGKLPNNTVIMCSLWDILLYGDRSNYVTENGTMTIPEIDVEASARKLFGSGYEIEHKSIADIDFYIEYMADINSYMVPEKPRYFPYSPDIVSISNVGETYKLVVGYVPPGPTWLGDIDKTFIPTPDKFMEYTVTKTSSRITIIAIDYYTGHNLKSNTGM